MLTLLKSFMKLINYHLAKLPSIKAFIFCSLIFRLLVSLLPAFEIDERGWRFWSMRMAELGPARFYSPDIFTSNPPGFLYIFWLIGLIKKNLFPHWEINSLNYDLLLKLPTNLADIFSGLIIYLIIKEKLNTKWAILGFSLFVFNPAIFFNSSIFGQFDGFASLFSLLALYLFTKYKNPEISILLFAVSWAIKPQAIAIAPVLLVLILLNVKPLRYLTTFFTFIVANLIIYLPFFPKNPVIGFFNVNKDMTNIFSCTTCFAFNFWGVFGNWKSDLISFFNIKFIQWGIILFSVVLGFILLKKPFAIKFKSPFIYLTAAISISVFFTFLTRMHERYLFSFFPFFLIGAILLRSKLLLIIYLIFSLLSVINIYLPYAYYNTDLKLTPNFITVLTQNFNLLSAFEVFLFALTTFIYLRIIKKSSHLVKNPFVGIGSIWRNMRIKFNISQLKLNSKKLLILILLFTFFSRVARIGYPNTYVFDEVYHAFTAKEYLKGSIKAWGWWNTPPPGVAYEWTHPPLAKEVMTASMFILNSTDAWAYRIPGVLFGTLSVYLLYLLGKTLFKSNSAGLISALIFSLDGLNFVQSRTGMNDIYFVTFSLLCLVLYFRNKFFFSSVALGLALASKWTTFYLFGIIFVLLLWNRKIKKIPLFLVIPVIVYLLSYVPFFTTGHNFNQFLNLDDFFCTNNCTWGLQHQMWYYHTHLKAHHDYSSPWWSWPLNLYPVWYFVQYYTGPYLSNIFASGNPVVFWLGFISLILAIKDILINKTKTFILAKRGLLIAVLGYLFFWLPWAISPRIMFLYHYSPSVPFMCLSLGYYLNKLWIKKSTRNWAIVLFIYLFLGFALLYPVLTGVVISKDVLLWFFRTNLTKNPFGS